MELGFFANDYIFISYIVLYNVNCFADVYIFCCGVLQSYRLRDHICLWLCLRSCASSNLRGTFTDLSQLIYSHYFKSFPLACQYPWGERGIVGVKKVSRLGTQQHGGQTLGMRKRSIIVGCTPISRAKVNGKHENNNKSRKISEKKLERS